MGHERRNKNEEPREEREPLSRDDAATLVDSIKRIEAGMKAVNASGLKRHAIVVLLADSTRVSKRNINKVLDGLGQLAATYIEVREGRQKL